MRICIFLGSRIGEQPEYRAAAHKAGECLAARRIGVVYGGASIGLMGELALSARKHGGEVFGVIPTNIAEVEIPADQITRLIYTDTLAERERIMFEMADAFLALPGGIGTMEEVFTVIAWNTLKYHQKPIGFLNTCGFYDKFMDLLNFQCKQGFVSPNCIEELLIDRCVDRLVAALIEKSAGWKAANLETDQKPARPA